MPVTEVRTHGVRVPLHTPFVTAVRSTRQVEALLVEVRDEDGRSGWGEATENWRVTGSSIAGAEAAVAGPLAAAVVGSDPDDLEPATRAVATAVAGNQAAVSAVDCALHDLAAARLGVPLGHLLGTTRRSVPTDVTLAVDTPERMRDAALLRRAEGFTVLKVKLGRGEQDLARLTEVAEAAGASTVLRVDANQGWTPKQAIRLIRAVEDRGLNVEFVEQPVAAGDIEGLAEVTRAVGLPVMADESVWSTRDALHLVRTRAVDMINVKLAKCGGLRAARHLVALAEASGVGVLFGSMMETHVGVAATAALAATASGTGPVADLDAAWWLARSPVMGGAGYDGAAFVLSDAPGLGITALADPAPALAPR
ncbi:mandelate racemase/muconate lactonizing enzyme family protein [Streptomyces reniochalinae]|uniref:Dipeptide epimerase n=1 Tax=Streptomyces reniochalinae TaxID=2250578 RepID=A0A367EDG1_9ACTN|nr:dipeptide epimerase [Streptomyces reniochalinae]RCG15993.1 dipeptide epimerase [Streptomyces reniochalinae]